MAEEDTGALPASGRFERMERALERIETKLDAKADAEHVQQLEIRVAAHGREIDSIQHTVNTEARQAFALATTNSTRLSALETHNANESAVDLDRESRNRHYATLVTVVAAVATAINMVGGLFILLGPH